MIINIGFVIALKISSNIFLRGNQVFLLDYY